MTDKWEYTAVYNGSVGPNIIGTLNDLGAVGWELIGIAHGWHYLKRPATAEAKGKATPQIAASKIQPLTKAKTKPKAKAKAKK